MPQSWVIGLIAGIVQGIFEWLPISSEGNLAIVMTAIGASPHTALAFALFLQSGTALSATAYYRGELVEVLQSLPSWRPGTAFEDGTATLSFIVLGTLVSGVVGAVAYFALAEAVTALAGGSFVAIIGILLVGTGLLQRFAGDLSLGDRAYPTAIDAVLVGALQGLAILPGVSRSGTTASALLLRGHDGPSSLRLSFLLSIPAAVGAGVLAIVEKQWDSSGVGDGSGHRTRRRSHRRLHLDRRADASRRADLVLARLHRTRDARRGRRPPPQRLLR